MIRAVLKFMRELRQDALEARDSDYRAGYIAAIEEVEEYTTDLMWEEGMDDDDED